MRSSPASSTIAFIPAESQREPEVARAADLFEEVADEPFARPIEAYPFIKRIEEGSFWALMASARAACRGPRPRIPGESGRPF